MGSLERCLWLSALTSLALLSACGESSSSTNGSVGAAGSGGKTSQGGSAGVVGPQGGAQLGGTNSGGRAGAGSDAAGRTSGGSSTGGVAPTLGGSSQADTGGEKGEGGNSVGDPIAALESIINAYCQAAQACCERDAMMTKLANCKDDALSRLPLRTIARGDAFVDANAAAACLAAYQEAATRCEARPVVDACRRVIIGTNTAGESCTVGAYECRLLEEQSICLLPDPDAEVGACKYPPRGKAGDPCQYTCPKGQSCAVTRSGPDNTVLTMCFESDGLYCDFSGEAALCAPLVGANMPCPHDSACGSDARCRGTCQPAGTEGEDCAADCRLDLSCVDGKCVPTPFANGSVCIGYSYGP